MHLVGSPATGHRAAHRGATARGPRRWRSSSSCRPCCCLHHVFIDVPAPPGPFATIGLIMPAVIPMFMMFVVTSVTMLRERVSGTLERVLTTPLRRWHRITSYAVVFGLLAVLQSLLLASAFARTEFQAVQFMPVFITPQVFLCGLLVPEQQRTR